MLLSCLSLCTRSILKPCCHCQSARCKPEAHSAHTIALHKGCHKVSLLQRACWFVRMQNCARECASAAAVESAVLTIMPDECS